jgi:uncharacterized protein DUF6650
MKFSEIANRLTGISTPLGGVSWQPTDLEVSAARRVIAFLEDRRVLYAPDELEVPDHCVHSVLEIRHFLSGELGKLDTMGRFMTPDPLPWVEWQNGSDRAQRRFQAYINNPQNFNMYAYVRNNPTNLTDPTEMYVCKGTKDQCAAIQAGLDKAKEALKGNDLNKQQKAALQKVIGFYGKAGDANGVVVQFGKTGAGTGGNTDSSKVFNANITTITFSPTKFAGLSTLQQAEEEVHEGVHGENGVERGGRNPANKAEELTTERNAYRTQSYVPQGLGVADGGWGLWDPTWPAAQAEGDRNSAVDSNAQKSTAAWCAAGGDCQ